MTIEIATNIGPAKLAIAYERLGAPDAPPVLLIMGLGRQLISWSNEFCGELIACGLQLVRFDNRDAGQSTHFTGMPDFAAAVAGDRSGAPYTLSDMAADAIGLLDALGLDSVHLVGASMGGFIAQTIAIEHPERVRSLTSMMATTGDRAVGQLHPEAMRLFAGGSPRTRDEVVQRAIEAAHALGSPGYPPDLDAVVDRAGREYARVFDPIAIVRQAVATLVSGDRTARLREVRVPALVIHGADDRMCDVSGGIATAAAIPGAELAIIEGMGHDLPRALWPDFAAKIAAVVTRGEATKQRQ